MLRNIDDIVRDNAGKRVLYLLNEVDAQRMARERFNGMVLTDEQLVIIGRCIYREPDWRDVLTNVIRKHIVKGEDIPNKRRDIG